MSIVAGYGASPNGGYASSRSIKYASARTRHRMTNRQNCRMPMMCSPAITIVNQLTMARNPATAPSRPPSLPILGNVPSIARFNPTPAPPTRIMCGIARIPRNATVTRSRFASSRSTVMLTGYGISLSVNHELEQIAVRVASVSARTLRLASARPRNRTFFHTRTGGVEPRLELRRRAVPHETQVAARRLGRRRAQREGRVLPTRGTVEVDHVAADVDGDCGRRLTHLEAELLVERDHRVHIQHRQRHVVVSAHSIRRL